MRGLFDAGVICSRRWGGVDRVLRRGLGGGCKVAMAESTL